MKSFGKKSSPTVWLASLIVTILVGGVIITAFWNVIHAFSKNATWVEEVDFNASISLKGRLIQDLIDTGVIWPVRGAEYLAIDHVDCSRAVRDNLEDGITLSGPVSAVADPDERESVRRLLSEFCTTDLGGDVRADISQFNEAQLLIAVRDNRDGAVDGDHMVSCIEGRQKVSAFNVFRGCLPSRWQIMHADISSALQGVDDTVIPIWSFAYLAGTSRQVMSDWTVATPGAFASLNYDLVTRFETGGGTANIQIIGDVGSIFFEDRELVVQNGALNATTVLFGNNSARVSMRTACESQSGTIVACSASDHDKVTASEITLSNLTGDVDFELRIRVNARGLPFEERFAQNITVGGRTVVGEGEIGLLCEKSFSLSGPALAFGEDDTSCTVQWPEQFEESNLFAALLEAGLLWPVYEESGVRLEVMACGSAVLADFAQAQRMTGTIADMSDPTEMETAMRLAEAYCLRNEGRAIAHQLSITNATPFDPNTMSPDDRPNAIRFDCDPDLSVPRNAPLVGMQGTGCDMEWAPQVGKFNQKESAPFQLVIDGVEVLNENGTLTQRGWELGYGDLLGAGVEQPGSFAATLAQTELPPNFTLTVRPGMQALLQRNLLARWSDLGDPGTAKRGVLMVMDADGDDAGAVLGFASLPLRPAALSSWDFRAIETADAKRSAFPAHAWTAHDNLSTPGSTFKLITALSLGQLLLDDNPRLLEGLLFGDLSAGQVRSLLDLGRSGSNLRCTGTGNPPPTEVVHVTRNDGSVSCISNFGNDEFAPSNSVVFGLRKAIQYSSNLFFAGSALTYFEPSLQTPSWGGDGLVSPSPISNVAMVQHVLGQDSFEAQGLGVLDALSPIYSFVTRLRPSPTTFAIVADEDLHDAGLSRFQVAQSGMGQAVSATPLAIITVAASIAEGRVVSPRVIPLSMLGHDQSPQHIPLLSAPAGSEQLAADILELIRAGMNDATRAGGTARSIAGANPTLTDFLHFKTGTAQIKTPQGSLRNSVWTVGYVDVPGSNSGLNQRLALVCQYGPTNSLSGVCARLLGEVIRDLNAGRNQ